MATKKSYIAKPSDTVDFDEVMRRLEAAPSAKPVEQQSTGFARGMGDRALALGQGVVGGVKMLSDLAGPDNMVSQNLGRSNAAMQDLYSPARKEEMQNRQALIQAADDSDSTLDQITTRLGGIVEAPLQTTLQAAGSMAPNIAAAVATGGVSAGPGLAALAARVGLPAALGIGMGVGSVKGQNFEAVFQKAKQEGQTDDQATALALKASEYSAQNAPQQALGGALGVLDSLTGAEKIVGKLARKDINLASKGVLQRAAMGGVSEALPEGAQGAQGQYAQNEALNNSGFHTNPYAGVLGAGISDAVVGTMLGAPLGAVNGRTAAPGVTPPAVAAPPAGPLARAASTVAPGAVPQPGEAEQQTTDLDPADDPIAARIETLPDAIRDEARKAYAVLNNPKAAKGIQDYNKKLLDRHLSQASQEFLAEKEAQDQEIRSQVATESIAPVTERVDPETGEVVTAYDQRQADAPKQQEGDILNLQGIPFTTIVGAKARQKELGDDYQVIRLAGTKYVVRAVQSETAAPDAGTAATDAQVTVPATTSAADAPAAELSAQPSAVDVQDAPPAARTQTQAQAVKTPEAGAPLEAGATAAGAVPGASAVQATGVGRDYGDRLSPAQSAKLQEAHKALGRDVTRQQVQRMRDSVEKEIASGTLRPKAVAQRQEQLARLDADIALFSGQSIQGGAKAIAPVDTKAPVPAADGAAKNDAVQIANAVEYADNFGLTGNERRSAILSDLAGVWSMTPDEVLDVAAVKVALRKKPSKQAKAIAIDRIVDGVKKQAIAANRQMEEQGGSVAVEAAGVEKELEDARAAWAVSHVESNGTRLRKAQAAVEAATSGDAKFPPMDIRVGQVVRKDGEDYTVTGGIKDGIAATRVERQDGGVTQEKTILLKGDDAFAARVEAVGQDVAAVNIKAATAKLIPDMSDAELTALQAHYGPDHKRTPKLAKEIEKRASNQAPAQSIQAQAAPESVAPELVKVGTLGFGSIHVKKSELDGSQKMLGMYAANGQRLRGGVVARENLDLTGEKLAALNAENADNPFFNVITTKDGNAFTTQMAARRELNKRGLADTHAVVAADTVQAGATGFVIQKQQKEQPNENQRPVQQPAGRQEDGQASQQTQGTTGKAEADQAVKPEAPTTHAGLKIYQIKVKAGDEIKIKWAVQTLNNAEREKNGERQLGGDPLADTLEEAKALADGEVESGKRMAAYRAEMAERDEQSKAITQAKKDANKGKSIVEHRADAMLDKPTNLHPNAGVGTGTRREAMQKAVEQGRYIDRVMIPDTAAKKRDEDYIYSRRNLPTGNINYPGVKEYFEVVARKNADDYKKPDYRLYTGQDKTSSFYEISKTEYDYVQGLIRQRAKLNAAPAPASKPELTEDEKISSAAAALVKYVEDFAISAGVTNASTLEVFLRGGLLNGKPFYDFVNYVPKLTKEIFGDDKYKLVKNKTVPLENFLLKETGRLLNIKVNSANRINYDYPKIFEYLVGQSKAAPVADANTVFTEDAAAAARAILKKKLGTLNTAIDPELLQAGLTLAGYHIEKGARTFAAYAKAMIADLGADVKPYLKSWYAGIAYDPRAAGFTGMDSMAVMESVNLDEITAKADTGGQDNGNATQQLDKPSAGTLGGAPAQEVRTSEEKRDAGASSDRSRTGNIFGNAEPSAERGDLGGSMGADTGVVPVPARGAKPDAKNANKPRLPRPPRAAKDNGLFGAAGGLTPDTGANPAPNAPPIAAPQPAAEDFTITDELTLGEGGQKTKFRNNVAAIRLLGELADRMATPDEQKVLAKYVGWGGIPQAFDPSNADWAKEYAELSDLIPPTDFAEARKSTRYAHYTSREIIVDGIYAAMRQFGFTGGRTLEAGAGVGNFIGMMPADMRSAGRFTAIEREPFSSAIARQLYPQQNVQRADFTEFKGTDGYFDAAVGNPPFASDPQTDRSGRKHLSGLSLHNYFFAKNIDMLREGGIMAQVVTNSFLDAKGDKARKYISDRAELLGAIRLPNSAFAKNANTEVTTDIIFLKKRPDSEVGGKAARADAKRWLDIGTYTDKNGKQVALNQYFIDNPSMMLGDFGAHGSMYGPDFPALIAKPGQDTLALLKEAVGKLPAGVYKSIADTGTDSQVNAAVVALKNPSVKEGGYFVEGDKLTQRLPDIAGEARGVEITAETQWTEKTKLGEPGLERIKSLAAMRSTVRGLLAAEMSDDAKGMTALRKTLNEQYDTYRATHGLINDQSTLRVFDDDPDFPLLASLEHGYTPGIGPAAAKRLDVKPTVSTAKKGPIFSQRVVAARQTVQKVKTPADALAVSMAERGKLDAAYIGTLLGMEPEAVLKELSTGDKPLLFRDPATDEFVLRDAYLSGNVRAKLVQAKQAGMFTNINALEAVQPEDVGSHEITARLGSPWVPTQVYKDFAQTLYGEESKAFVSYVLASSTFQVVVTGASEVAMNNTWGTPEFSGSDMLQALMNNRTIKVTYRDSDGKTHTNVDATEKANTKAQEIKEKFNDWLFSDPERSELLTKAYNETNNNYVTRVYDGSNMNFPGKVPDSIIKFRRHQRNAIARIVQDRTALLDHVVGAGKTFTVISGAMELKRTGLARKPMVVVPNHLVKQWAADFYRLYPGANVLTATKKDFEKANRRKFLARIATGDWDAVVIAHSSYGFIKPSPEFEAEFNGREIQKIMTTIQTVEAEDGDKQTKKRTVKQLEGMKERLENRIKALRDKPMDDLLDFEQIGVDQLFVDEAHMFKNLMYTTKMQGVAGLNDPTGSQRAYDMYVKTNQVMEKNGRGQGVVFATGTPVSNSLAEMYHMMRYLMPAQMKELGFESFDAWANTYASVEQVWMQAPSGDGFKAQNRMSNFVNTPELLKMFDQVSDTVTMDDIKKAYSEENNGDEFPLPKLKGGRRTPVSLEKSAAQNAYMNTIAERAKAIEKRKGPPQKGDDNILVVMSDARKAAMDIRLVNPDITEREPGGRLDRSTDEVLARYKQFDAVKGTQLVFSDLGTPLKQAKKELAEYEAMLARVQAGNEDVATSATLGNEAAMGIMEDAEAAQAELDAMGPDWLSAVKSAMRGFSIYDDFKAALIEKGVPEAEIAFIHDANTDDQKAALFRKVNAGHIRVLLGSTAKMGAGTNVQDRLVAEHHLDVPWRPSDVEQREGRIERQGNLFATPPTKDKGNPHHIPGFEIEILAYVTRDTLDMRMWQVQETKLKMINQLRTRKIGREIDNAFEDMELSAGEMQAAATGDINLLKEIQLRNDVKKLEQRRRSFDGQRNDLIARKRRNAEQLRDLPKQMQAAEAEAKFAEQYKSDLYAKAPPFKMNIDGKDYTDAKEAQEYLRVKDEATVESTDLAGEVTTKKAPLSVTIDGELIKNRNTMGELLSNVLGDAAPIMWEVNGKTYRRRTVLANAMRQNVLNALADENVQQVGTIGAYSVAVEGSTDKSGAGLLEVTMRRDGDVKLSNQITIGESNAAPARVIAQVENLMQSAISEANYLERALERAQKDAAELNKVEVAGDWPDQPKLDAARAAHKDVLTLLKKKNEPAAGDATDDETPAMSRTTDQTNTPAFKKWFGDSKVVDADGKPLVVYHGTPNKRFNVFDWGKARDGKHGTGFYFTTNRSRAEDYAGPNGRIIVAYLKIDNLFDEKTSKTTGDGSGKNFGVRAEDLFVVMRPEQIKSATGNNGDFDGSNPDIRYSRSTDPAAAQSIQAVERIVQSITSRWANAPEVVVVYDMTDPRIPAKVRAQDLEQRSGGATGDPEGFFLGGKAYIVASQVSSQKDVARVLMHESLGHFGLRGVFGEQLKPILQQLAGLRRKEVAAKAKQYGLDMAIESQRLQAAEEVLAEMAQTRPEMGFVKRAIAIIRSWLRRNVPGFKNLALTDADIIANYIIPARGFVERGRAAGKRLGAAGVPAYSFAGSNADIRFSRKQLDDPTLGWNTLPDALRKMLGSPGYSQRPLAPIMRDVDAAGAIRDQLDAINKRYDTAGSVTDQGLVTIDKSDADYIAEIKAFAQEHGLTVVARKNFSGSAQALTKAGFTTYSAPTENTPSTFGSVYSNPVNQFWSAQGSGVTDETPMFSRTLTGALNNAQDLKLPAGYIVNDFFKGDGKLSFWHKTVGTQYNLAQRSPVFKKVFDGTQDFINDVSKYATEAADLAPSILPKLESMKDLAKSPIAAADNKAIAAPIFEGTLVWMRDGAGKPVKASVMEEAAAKMGVEEKAQRLYRENKVSEGLLKMWQGLPMDQYEKLITGKYEREFLKPGIVFTRAELKSLFKLTDGQVKLYNEFRAATDASLTSMAVADMIRFGGQDVAAVREQALAMGDVDAAAVLMRDHLLERSEGSNRADVLIDTANKMIDKADKARDLMNRGYAPLSRFGSYSLDVVDENGGRVYFGLFESKAEANKMARQMRANFPKGTISQGTMSDEEYKLFAGVSPETLEIFGEMLGLESGGDEASHQAFQQYLKLAKANRSAMKRLIQRKGIAGFSEDPGRVLAGFVYSNARQTSAGLHMGGIAEAVRDIPKGQGELKDAAMRLFEYVKNPQEEAQQIRGLLFAQYLGGSIASALINLTQPVNVTFPWLSQYGGAVKAAGQIKNAIRDSMKGSTGEKALDAALKQAEVDGIVSPQEVFQLMAQAQGNATLKPGDGTTTGDALAKGSNALSKLSLAWGKVFGLAEQFNRRTTFIAAYRTAIAQNLGDPAKFAERAVNETQFVYNKGAKPRWARGAVGGVLFTFKSYSINYVELLSRMATQGGPEGKRAALLALGMLFLMAGSGGLPFAEDMDDIIDGVMQRLGYNFSSKQAKQEFFTGILGRDGAQFVEKGISGIAGVPIDVSGRMGMGNLLPGTGLFTKKQDYSRDMLELVGPIGDLTKRAFEATGKLVDGNITGRTGAVATMSPVAARNIIQAIDMANTGMYRDVTGKKIIDTDGYDVLAKSIGFQPNNVARVQGATRQVQSMIAQNKIRESEIANQWAQGLFEKDADKVQDARDSLKRWNEANPSAPIRIQMPQIIKRVKAMREDKTTRIAKTAPSEIRASVRRELAEKE